METVFVSSVIGGLESVRAAAKEAIESVGMRPVMAETAGARPQSPQAAFLTEVAHADIYLLLLGARYGDPGASGLSPTEDEFEEAKRGNKPIVILRQDVAMEPAQQAFLERAGGGWEEGVFWDRFTDDRDVGMKIVRALTNVRQLGDVAALAPPAQEHAVALAEGEQRGYGYSGGSQARIALVPLSHRALLDDLALDDASIPDRLAELARTSGLVSQAAGIEADVRSAGITLTAGREREVEASLVIGRAGEIVAEGSVSGDDQHFGTSRVDPEKLTHLVGGAGRFAAGVWRQLDPRGQVQQAAVAVGIPNASTKVYGRPATPSSSLSMGGMSRLPGTVVAPQPALLVRRADVEGEEMRRRLVASVRRVFADAGSIQEGA
jgi:hypothetical protein